MSEESATKLFSELSSSLKDNFSTEIGSLKSSIDELGNKMELSDKEKEGMTNISDFVEHMRTCTNDNCEVHKAQNTLNNNNYMKGFILGAKFGKQKRS